ncbi:phosphotransferase [Nevskia sp.]|uniref:aminoglycoside phosphotransferase family protein n=1 Tax=Nevskia sp. TaxID=1929292 RepID=UPI00345AED42
MNALTLADAHFAPASADASFRRYFRVSAQGQSWIVMDAPPEREDCGPFLKVGALLLDAGVNVPQVVAQDLDQGFLLLTDLGRQTYLDVINEANADALFAPAIAALIRWQRASKPGVLPDYDAALLARELALFPDWYLARHLGIRLSGADLADWNTVCERLIAAALAQPKVYVHRDYMPRNLMLSAPAPDVQVGVLDHQDAVHGPIAYDPICLFKDAFLSWPEARVDGWLRQYHAAGSAAGLPLNPDYAAFRRDADWIGVQRHLKVLGIFARINYRDGKPKYLADTPRFIRYVIDVARRYPELAPLAGLFERLVLPRVPLE